MAAQPFWYAKKLHEMSDAEWESLCDGCGKCCLHKLEDEDTGEVYYTDVACRLLDTDTCRCADYAHRQTLVPECLVIDRRAVDDFHWLPLTCAYRLVHEGHGLPDWHPLITASADSVHRFGISVRRRTVAEVSVGPDEWEDHVVRWVI